MYARLEQLVKPEQEKFLSLIETQSTRIDYYETLITALYTGPIWELPYKGKKLGNLKIRNITSNTITLTEKIGPITNTYIHHERGPGRMTVDTLYDRLDKKKLKW